VAAGLVKGLRLLEKILRLQTKNQTSSQDQKPLNNTAMSIFNKFKKIKMPISADKPLIDADTKTQTNQENISINQPKSLPAGRQEYKSASLLIKQAWVTEKATDLSGLRKYIFIVDGKANKPETKKAIESIYGVKIESVNIINTKGKAKRLGRSLGRTSAFKKAIVTLKEGEKIDIVPT
jgi:large subunit ribosomal protein L23